MLRGPHPPGFVRRTQATTTVASVVVALWLWGAYGVTWAVCYLVGVGVGLLLLAGDQWVVERAVRPPEIRPRRWWPLLVVHVGKLVVAAGTIYLVSRWNPRGLGLVAVGYGTPIAVMLLKLAGSALNRRTGIDQEGQ